MKYIKSLALMLMCLCFMGSCTTIQKTASTSDIQANVWQYPVVADLDISPVKITKTTSWYSFFSTMSKATRQSNLTAEMLLEADADVLVEPNSIYKKEFPSHHTLTVTGFPAKFKNFRKATDKDLEALRIGNPDIRLVSEPFGFPYKKKTAKKKKFLFF